MLVAWRLTLGRVVFQHVADARAESFYWLTILVSNTLGTAIGDFTSDSLGLGFVGGSLIFGLLLLGAFSAFGNRETRHRRLYGLGAGFRGGFRLWRPTAGLLAIVLFAAALVLLIREDWLAAIPLAIFALSLALSARWRGRKSAVAGRPPGGMSEAEARSILGVGPAATPQEVQAAYKRLMGALHPDRGGTAGLAAQLNAAREALAGRNRS